METPLITEEGGNSSRGGRRGWDSYRRLMAYQTRSDAIAYGSTYQRAASLVDLAEDGIGLPEELFEDSRFERAAKFYFMYTRFNLLWTLNLLALVVLNFIEKPLWCSKHGKYSCEDREYFFLGELPYLTSFQSVVYEGVTLLVLVLYTFLPITYEGWRLYWKNTLNVLKVTFLFLLMCDLVVYAFYLSPIPLNYLPIRLAPYIRVAYIIINVRELRSCIRTLAGMMQMYLNILALWFLFLLVSSWIAYVTFEDTQQGKTVFTSFPTTLYQMFVLFTTSNNPDVWIPAYKSSRWSSLFFILYVLLGVYFITNLILAVVYDSFKAELAKQVAEMDSMRIRILKKAFTTIDENNYGFLNKTQCVHLFEELNKYRSLPNISEEDFESIFSELDDSGDFKINMDEFADLCNAIALRFQKEPALDIQNSSSQKFWQTVEFVFGWLYVLEMGLKIFSHGFDSYWSEGQNRFDFFVTLIIVIGETATFFFPQVSFLSNGEWIRYLLIARMLRLIRLLMHIKRYRAFVATFLNLIPSLMPYLGIIFCILCVYCSLGVQLFGGIVNLGNPKLDATELSDNDYLLFNFNDYPNGMVTLFNLLVMGNWQVWMQSYKDLTGTSWTLAYFISFYLLTVLLLLNLVLAFVLEAFFTEINLEEGVEPEEKKDSREGNSHRRLVGYKSRSRTVDTLLHRMLSSELNESQN